MFQEELNEIKGFRIDTSFFESYKDSPQKFVRLNRLASQICGTPVSLVNMLDVNFQYTISKVGDWSDSITRREETVCQFTVQQEGILVINDTAKDKRTKDIPELRGEETVRFYAGMPIRSPNTKDRIGAFCVLDYEPRKLSDSQKQALKDLAYEVEERMKLIKQSKILKYQNSKFKKATAFLSNSADILLTVDSTYFTIVNAKGAEHILGYSNSEIIGKNLFSLVKEVNVERHIKTWATQHDKKKLGIPIQFTTARDGEIWLNLTFTEYDNDLLITGRDFTKQHLAEEKLRKSLTEKEILLSEVHHRVKNNLAVVMGMLQLERFKNEDDDKITDILKESEGRIITISKIHEMLYQTESFSEINLKSYIADLTKYIKESFLQDKQDPNIEVRITDIEMNVNQALPIGLILNEILTNSIKHAFNGEPSDEIVIDIAKLDKTIVIEVSDNGKGLDIDSNEILKEGNLGFTLIETLRKQLKAELSIDGNNGTTFTFTFEQVSKKGSVSSIESNNS